MISEVNRPAPDNHRSSSASPRRLRMASRGSRLAQQAALLARLQPTSAPRIASDTQAPTPSSGAVALVPPVAGVTHVPEWETVAREQGLVNEGVLERAPTGTAFALDDRNIISTSASWRHVYAVRDGDHFVVYDANGRLIVEKDDGLPNGRQLVEDLVNEFTVDGMYYRPGKVRQSPATGRRHQATVRADDVVRPQLSFHGAFRCLFLRLSLETPARTYLHSLSE